MTLEQKLDIYRKFDEELVAITRKKGADYANEDVLSNFKEVSRAAEALNIDVHTPVGYALFMAIMKICRITNLFNNDKTPENEAITDSFKDGVNYFKLAYCCFLEENSPKTTENATFPPIASLRPMGETYTAPNNEEPSITRTPFPHFSEL